MSYGGFSFIFFRDSVTENVTERKMPSHQIVLNLLKENPMRSREEMAGLMGKTVRTVQRALDKLSDEGRIRRIGTARAGYWEVVQHRQKAYLLEMKLHKNLYDEVMRPVWRNNVVTIPDDRLSHATMLSYFRLIRAVGYLKPFISSA